VVPRIEAHCILTSKNSTVPGNSHFCIENISKNPKKQNLHRKIAQKSNQEILVSNVQIYHYKTAL